MRTLVTGGAGFIGSNLVDALVARGDQVTVIDDLSSGSRENLASALEAGAELQVGDVRDRDAVEQAFAAGEPELVFHLAAQMDVRRSIEDPGFDASVNVVGTANLLDAARRHGVGRFVNTSTGGAIYGDTDVMPTPESVPPEPVSPYGQSKQCAELYCGWAGRLYGLPTVTLRYGNVYGPRQDPAGEAGVIAIFCGRVLDGERPVVFGDGTATRDYTYVSDIVAANLAAADNAQASGAFNIGTGVESSVLEMIEALRKAAGLDGLEPEFRPPRSGELERSSLDVGLAGRELGFTAQVPLEQGIALTLDALR
ncbi:MAG: NAD-dependent epimerase/dehydratase family protein [Acidobacteria bacterium]|nr:NAD-dependent epimerase/dehydratase family protein [Acidobacteriota bacterium]